MSPAALIAGVWSIAACGSSQAPADAETPASSPETASSRAEAPGPKARPRTAPGAAAPKDAAECQAMVGTAAAKSETKVTAAPGAGGSERFEGIIAAVKEHRGALRCCYDLWAKDNPGQEAKVSLSYELDQGGAVARILLKGDGDKLSPDAQLCLVDVATAIPYPASKTGKLTTFEYDLGFKPRP
jgi:hypothetical protein